MTGPNPSLYHQVKVCWNKKNKKMLKNYFFKKVPDHKHRIIIFMPKKQKSVLKSGLFTSYYSAFNALYFNSYWNSSEFCWAVNLLTPIVVKFLNLIYSGLTFHNGLELEFISLVLTNCFPERHDGPLREDEKWILYLLEELQSYEAARAIGVHNPWSTETGHSMTTWEHYDEVIPEPTT